MDAVEATQGPPIEEALVASRARFVAFVQKRIDDPFLAEDIVQESLLKAIRSAPPLDDNERLTAWFYRVLNNAIVDTYRRRGVEKRRVTHEMPEVAEPDAEEERNICACFQDLLPSLKPEYAEIISRLDLDGETPEAAAASLGITPNNLKVRRHRARQALRQRLEETCRMCAQGHCLDCDCARD